MDGAASEHRSKDSADLRRLHARIHGSVQRVGFRLFVRDAAQRLGLTGWVRNRRGGTVEVMAQGAQAALEQLLAALHAGPDGADVGEVVVEWLPATDRRTDFRVRWFGFL